MKHLWKQLAHLWKLMIVLILLTVTFMYAMFQGGFVSWFLFYSFLPIVIYSIGLFFYPIRSFHVRREVNQEEFWVGDRLTGKIDIFRQIPFPIFYLVIEEKISSSLAKATWTERPKTILFPWFKRHLTFEYSISEIPRGEHHLQGIRLKVGDLFGFIEKEVTYSIHNDILVYPRYVNMQYAKREDHINIGNVVSRNRYVKDTSMAISVRDYESGDRLSWIDWKATARRNKMMTKEFSPTQKGGHVVVMDETNSKYFEEVVTFTASFIRSILNSGAELSFFSVGHTLTVFYPEHRERQLQKIFLHLAKVEGHGRATFSKLISETRRQADECMTYITSAVSEDLVQMLEQNVYSRGKSFTFIFIKGIDTKLSKREIVFMNRLRNRKVDVKVVNEEMFADVFSRGGSR